MSTEKFDIFVADAHLRSKDEKCAKDFVDFLEHIKNSTRTLYILGDLFDFWFGSDKLFDALYARYQPILDKLKELRDFGVNIVYFEGNHDFFMGRYFTETLPADVYTSDREITVDGQAFYMTHGDTFNHEDTGYLILRKVLRSPLTQFIMKSLPPRALLWIAEKMSKTSRDSYSGRKIMKKEILDAFIIDKIKKGAAAVILAHTHTPFIEDINGKYAVNPGAFADNGSYARYVSGRFTLGKFIQKSK